MQFIISVIFLEIEEPTENSYTGIKLRKYQEELAEKALEGKNTIICAVTNAGKTIVAFHIIEEHLRQNPNGMNIKSIAIETALIVLYY